MKSVEYWKRRAETRMYEELEKAEDTAGIIAKVYAKAARYLMDKAEHVFDRFKITECLTKEEALSLIGSLSNVEDTEELIRKLEADGSEEAQETLKRLRNTGAYGSRIQRLGEMLKQVNKIMTSVYGQELKEVTGVLSEIASDSYLKTIYDLQQRINTGFSVAHIDEKRIDKILRMNWSGEHFSKRIWNNTQKLGQTVKEQILEGALTGKTEREMADEIAQEFGKGAKVARRLVRTESCHVSSEVNAEAYEDSDIEMYLYLATLDLRTSEVCRALDGKRFPVSDRQVGENYPPMHPWCRSTTIAIVDEEYLKDMKRTYRDPETGRNAQVPLNMSYDEWYKKYVDNLNKSGDRFMAGTNDGWPQRPDIKYTENELDELKQYAESKGIRIGACQKFHGSAKLLKEQIDYIAEAKKLYKIKSKIKVSFIDGKNGVIAYTPKNCINYNNDILKNSKDTVNYLNKDNALASSDMRGIAFHECMHIFERENGIMGIDIASQAYYNVFKKKPSRKGLIEFLEKNVSEYCTTTYSFKSELKNKDFTEVTAEVIAKNATNPDEFTAEFDRLLRGVVDGRTES